MKNLLHLTSCVLICVAFLAANSVSAVEHQPTENSHLEFYNGHIQSPKHLNNSNNTIANVEFTIIDSLQNAYSFYTNQQRPFVYHTETGHLVMIKRGAGEQSGTPGNSQNTLNNLFILTSSDWGKTWDESFLVYDTQADGGSYPFNFARYPSVWPFMFDGVESFAISSPVPNPNSPSDASVWEGFISGFQNKEQGGFLFYVNEFNINNVPYSWATTANRVYGFAEEGAIVPEVTIHSRPTPRSAFRDGTNQNDVGYARTNDSYSDFESHIPEEWSSSIFAIIPTTEDNFQDLSYVSTSGFEPDENGNLYSAISGRFDNVYSDRFQPGVSKSTDNGRTWSEYNIFPMQLALDYMSNLPSPVPADDVSIGLPHGFCVYGEDKYSFIVSLRDVNESIPNADKYTAFIEFNFDGNVWTLNEVSEESGYIIVYPNADNSANTNQLGKEGQLSRTVDGKYLIFKWVDFAEYSFMGEQFDGSSYDVFVSVKNIETGSWSEKKNITNSEVQDRITWIPNLVPNDLKDIPLIRIATKDIMTNTILENSNELEVPQYVLMAHFNADDLTSVNEKVLQNNSLNIMSISPNPVDDNSTVNIYNSQAGQIELSVYDLTGRKLVTLYNGFLAEGTSAISINLNMLNSGSYFLRAESNGKFDIEILKIVR